MKTKKIFSNINTSYIRRPLSLGLLLVWSVVMACNKFVEVNELKDQVLADDVFNKESSANAAILAIYGSIKTNQISGTINGFGSLLSDDANFQYAIPLYSDFEKNTVQSNNQFLPWTNLYDVIYKSNSAIEGLQKSNSLSPVKRNSLLAEAKFWRAYSYFYLTNLFGEVPLLKTTDVVINAVASKSSVTEIYDLIIGDLLNAQANLPSDYSLSSGRKVRANKWAATAMLARAYLYQKKWIDAEKQATDVINSGLYTLQNGPGGIFTVNNQEAILQLDRYNNEPFTISDYLIPASNTSTTPIVCSAGLVNSFETADLRKTSWLYPLNYLGSNYYAAYKFTNKNIGLISELETPLRLSEQYLIRAEARVMLNDFTKGIDDINFIRLKHGGLSTALPVTSDQNTALGIVMHERRVELFTEEAHRWLDLKRTNAVNTTMQILKPATWKNTASLLPIPLGDVQKNSNLKQNPGYN